MGCNFENQMSRHHRIVGAVGIVQLYDLQSMSLMQLQDYGFIIIIVPIQ